MRGGRSNCFIFVVLINVIIFITLFVSNYSARHAAVKKTKCNMQNFYNAFTTADIQNIQQKNTKLRRIFTNATKFPLELMLENYLQIPTNKRESPINRRYQLLVQNCSHQMSIRIKYIIKLHADDCILDPSNYNIYYKRRRRIYHSTIPHTRKSEFLFKINARKIHFIYLNNKLNLLFCEQIGSEATYNVFHYRLRTRNCILQTKLPMPYLRLKRSIFQLGNRGTILAIILVLVIGVPILIILTSLFIIVVIYCCCQKNGTTEDELPKSLIENCRRAEPPPEEQGKYLPEPFDAAAFQFKGPLIIEYPKLHILEHDLTNAKPTGSSVKDHVQFDENLNVAYNIGENVEIIIKNYGQGTKIGSAEVIKEDGGDENDEITNEQENGSKHSIIENGEKIIAKHSKTQNTQSRDKRSGTIEMLDPRKKSRPVSVRTQRTQPSRYSESSTQTLRVESEANVRSPNERIWMDIRQYNSSMEYEARTKKSKLLRKRASTILLKQTDLDQAPAKSRKIMSANEHDALSIGANIMPTVKMMKSQQKEAEDANPSASGSSRSQYKSCDTSERMHCSSYVEAGKAVTSGKQKTN
ncbi:Uncharacterized protein BM_BM8276 [Brugia malayi]|uniref:Uncharacterized protein n=1 Tax=Brugia malayi TaxID=6279 RepID=A0A4E9FU89_BRUMA|nr:Uncharacterized protein BM_BM8276 [Brugia malayi]VIP00254.1 Uncharacterized protein BM_BM8276 [Brugia malayi]